MFKLATTSFIIPSTRINNAFFLKNIVDEIELLYFESKKNIDLPNKHEINELKKINLDYNIHMPIDLNLSHQNNWKIIYKFTDFFKPLNPTTHIFHPSYSYIFIKNILEFANYYKTSIENISSNLKIFDLLINTNITYCLDIGHAIMHKIDIYNFLKKYEKKISHIHLHGVNNGKDHYSIKSIDINLLNKIIEFANKNNIVLCLELFNKIYFKESLDIIRKICEEKNYTYHRWHK